MKIEHRKRKSTDKNLEDIRADVLALRSRVQVDGIVRWVGKDSKRFAVLMELYFDDDEETGRRAAWAMAHCVQKHPELAGPWLKPIVKKIQKPGIHEALRRAAMFVLEYTDIPVPLQGTVVNICFSYLVDVKISIAARAAALAILNEMVKEKPELANELSACVERMLPYSTGAFKSQAKKTFKLLDKIIGSQTGGKWAAAAKQREAEDKLLNEWLNTTSE